MRTQYYVKVDPEANPEFAKLVRGDHFDPKSGFHYERWNFVRDVDGVYIQLNGYPLVAPDLPGFEIIRVVLGDTGRIDHPLPGTYELGEATGYNNVYEAGSAHEAMKIWSLEVTAPTVESAIELFDGIRDGSIMPVVAYKAAQEPATTTTTTRRWSWRHFRWIQA